MTYRKLSALGGLLAVVWLVAGCSDDQIRSGSDAGPDTANDATSDAVSDTTADNGGPDVLADVADVEDGTRGPTFEERFIECSVAEDCEGNNQICHQQTCVRDPLVDSELWREENNDYVRLEGEPDFSCWATPDELGEANPPTARISGSVDLFGPESPTRNLCVTAYQEDLLLRWMVWLDENVCGEKLDEDMRTQDPYVHCFALDPCRCDDEDYTADRGNAADSVEACYAEIGYCDGIEDSSLLADCRDNVLARTGVEADTLIYGFTVSEEYPANPDRTEGVYTIESVPTNTRLVIKVSGRATRWRDTYEYGALIPASMVDGDGNARWDGNVITDGAWRTIPSSAGIPEPTPPENVAVAGVIRDCSDDNDRQVSGAQVGFTLEPVKIAYFNGVANDTLPFPGQAYTNSDGVYAAISAPAGPSRISVAVRQDGEVISGGVRDVFATPFSVVIATFEGNWE